MLLSEAVQDLVSKVRFHPFDIELHYLFYFFLSLLFFLINYMLKYYLLVHASSCFTVFIASHFFSLLRLWRDIMEEETELEIKK